MDWMVPGIINLFIVPAIMYLFFCRYCRVKIKWYMCAAYVMLSCFVSGLKAWMQPSQILCLPLDVLIFSLFGCIAASGKYIKSLTAALLIISVWNVCGGMADLLAYWAVDAAAARRLAVLKYADMAAAAAAVLLLAGTLFLIFRYFFQDLREADNLPLLLLLVPVFFIALTEKTISAKIYGDTLVWDKEKGIVFPVINHAEILMLQASAGICLFAVLAAFGRMVRSASSEQKLKLLEQQTKAQQSYVQEARSRYELTRSFRHDIKNHLLVLRKLLQDKEEQEAVRYLSKLEQVSEQLDYPVSTGNSAVDALLGSKLSIAVQEGISIECELRLPQPGRVEDMDWCIVLFNGVDNAIRACGFLEEGERYIRLEGKQKGNFYLLCIENSTGRELKRLPPEGTGLSNVRAVAEKYGGTVTTEAKDGVFRLNLLFVIS